MIPRYSRAEIAEVWSDRHRYRCWLRVETAVSEEQAKLGMIPKKDWQLLKKKLTALQKEGISPERVEFHEAKTKHDVIAFTTAVAEKIGPPSRYIHFGLTSSDVVDTALSIQIQEAGKIILKEIDILVRELNRLAKKYQNLPTIGRSHGIFAEPTSFGLKFLGWLAEWRRNNERIKSALENLRYGKLSGAVGVNSHFSPQIEKKMLQKLGLKREVVSTQVLPRDRHAEFLSALGIAGSSLERMAVELRHLQRTEVGEVQEGFSKGQKGSSAMPHKKNPISSENLTGVSRLLRSYAQASLENIALWHERDISHSSVERIVFPDATIVFEYALHRMGGVLKNLQVHQNRVKANLEDAGTSAFSGHFLLALVQEGISREEAYSWVQQCAFRSFDEKRDFVEVASEHPKIKKTLPNKKIKKLGSLSYQLRHVDQIYSEFRRKG